MSKLADGGSLGLGRMHHRDRRTCSVLAGWSALAILATLSSCVHSSPPADLVVFGRTWTGDRTNPWAAAVAARGDTILAVGESLAVAGLVGPKTAVLSDPGGLVVPGFIDGHVHFLGGGHHLASLDLRSATTPAEFIRRVREFASRQRPGDWITGGDWDHELWPGAPLPRRDWIDSVTPNNPVLLSRLDGHLYLANSAALKLAGLTRDYPPVPGGTIVKDPRTGEPTGALKDNAAGIVSARIPPFSDAQQDQNLEQAMHAAVERGVTAVSDMSGGEIWNDLAAYRRADAAGRLLLRISLYPPLRHWRAVVDTVTRAGHGNAWLQIIGVKGFADGSLGSRTALFFEPYADDPKTSGLFVTPEDSLRAWIGSADSAGLQVAVHAIGERANSLILSIYDSVARAHGPRDRRFRVEHAQHLREQDIGRFGGQGVIASMQAIHIVDDGSWAIKRLGPVRVHDSYVFRSLLDQGAHLQLGSDWPVAPLDPILGIAAAVTRRTRDGRNPGGWLPEERITIEEALRSYTSENAFGVFADATRGRLRPGNRADLVILDQDLFKIPPEEIENTRVLATVVGGKIVYQSLAGR